MLKLYNTLTRQKEEFSPLKPPVVTMYTCGPTVYGPGHIGHARSYITFDVLKRVLRQNGFSLKHVLNITDVHDDMIKEANRRETTIFELADKYISEFQQELKDLNIQPADFYPRVTEVIPEIIEMVKALVDKGYAYVTEEGSVYFQVSKFENYGRLSGVRLEEAVTGTRIETDKYDRQSPSDFALWKAQKPGEPFWNSPWGKGRPGWHIECSVMAKKFLGEVIDIHAGAMDLKFPHHENEIAQSEAVSGVPFARFWIHAGLLDVEGQKMSRSLGNVYTLEDLRDHGFTPSAFQYLTLMTHYRSKLNFTWEGLEAAQNALKRLRREVGNLKLETGNLKLEGNLEARNSNGIGSSLQPPASFRASSPESQASEYRDRFLTAINDDLNLPQALAVVWDLVKVSRSDVVAQFTARRLLQEFDEVLGLKLSCGVKEEAEVPEEVLQLVEEREKHRLAGHFGESDRRRQKILELGYTVEDTPAGPKVRKV